MSNHHEHLLLFCILLRMTPSITDTKNIHMHIYKKKKNYDTTNRTSTINEIRLDLLTRSRTSINCVIDSNKIIILYIRAFINFVFIKTRLFKLSCLYLCIQS